MLPPWRSSTAAASGRFPDFPDRPCGDIWDRTTAEVGQQRFGEPAEEGHRPEPDEPLWLTCRRRFRSLSYTALRQRCAGSTTASARMTIRLANHRNPSGRDFFAAPRSMTWDDPASRVVRRNAARPTALRRIVRSHRGRTSFSASRRMKNRPPRRRRFRSRKSWVFYAFHPISPPAHRPPGCRWAEVSRPASGCEPAGGQAHSAQFPTPIGGGPWTGYASRFAQTTIRSPCTA